MGLNSSKPNRSMDEDHHTNSTLTMEEYVALARCAIAVYNTSFAHTKTLLH